MENKEFIEVLKRLKEMTEDSQLAKYIEDRIIDLYHEMDPEETWLDRLEEATDCMRNDNESAHPGFCLAAFLGYGGCIHGTKLSCWDCWKTPVKEIDTLKE